MAEALRLRGTDRDSDLVITGEGRLTARHSKAKAGGSRSPANTRPVLAFAVQTAEAEPVRCDVPDRRFGGASAMRGAVLGAPPARPNLTRTKLATEKRIALLSPARAPDRGHAATLPKIPAAAAIFARADEILGYSLSRIAFDGPEEVLTQTRYCQPALFVHGLACLEALRAEAGELRVHAAAGLSLGEFTAHAAAGTFDFETGLRLVAKRGLFMQEACEATQGAMAAMIGGDESAVRALASEYDVDVANLNSPGQIVISGETAKVAAAVGMAKGTVFAWRRCSTSPAPIIRG